MYVIQDRYGYFAVEDGCCTRDLNAATRYETFAAVLDRAKKLDEFRAMHHQDIRLVRVGEVVVKPTLEVMKEVVAQ